ncbi:MAG TPA: ABC transporter substrate-binding protein [Frankiaceae bacterium]|nr:ABC transporter substrate-binding protein [Frankiaceae bacterium]
MRRNDRRRLRAGVALLMLVTTACSGAQLKNGQGPVSGIGQQSFNPDAPPPSGTPDASASASASAKPGGKGAKPGTPGTSGAPGAPGVSQGPGAPGGRVPTSGAPQPPRDVPGDLNLFAGALNTRGITNDRITLCAHAALTYADAFQTRPEDFNVFWSNVNDNGGIHGRRVEMTYEDDAYDSQQAKVAATTCANKDPFAILGGIGFDQIPGVRDWAEAHKELYIHHDATEQGLAGKQYSFTPIPTVEKLGAMFAELANAKFKGKRIGVVYRDSVFWKPGFDGFKAAAKRYGLDVVRELGVQKNQANYGQQLLDLQQNDVDVVFAWENALAATEMINQSPPGFTPSWMVFPFNLTTQTLTNRNLDIWGIASWPAYSHRDTSGPFASYAADIREFERQYAKYRPNVDLAGVGGDLLFLNWVSQKAFADVLVKCGAACTRNHFATLMTRYKGTVSPNCYADFPRFGGHLGSQAVNVFRTYVGPSGKLGWKPEHRCVEKL